MVTTLSDSHKRFVNSFCLALCYGIGFYVFTCFLAKIDIAPLYPGAKNLMNWDSGWYYSIVTEGYKFSEDSPANSAFFPLLPMIWKLLPSGPWGVSAVNLVFFSFAFAIFTTLYGLDMRSKILLLSMPSLYFVWIPYTEALFILCGVIVFYGIVKKSRWITWAGLFFISLTRPTAMVLLPALLITELITNNNKSFLISLKNFFVNYALPLVTGTFLFFWYVYYSTGVWFAFFKQEVHWGHEFAWPTFPLNSMNGPKLLWLNGIALFIGLISLIMLVVYGVRWLIKNVAESDKLLVLSLLYFTGVSLTTILFNPIWGTYTTNVYDVHRYVFASPFIWIFLHRFVVAKNEYKPVHFLGVLLLANLFWLCFRHYQHIQYALYFNAATLYFMLFMLFADKKNTWAPMILVAINILLQVNMFQWFLAIIYPG